MKILTIVPFYSGDSAQAAAMLDWMADLSGQRDRVCILAHESQVPAQEVERGAGRAFKTVEHLIVTAHSQGWPISANCYFGQIVYAMRGRAPWLLLEPDCTFVHRDGLAMLEGEVEGRRKPHIGTIIPAYFKMPDGQWAEKHKMLAGVAVYHPSLWDESPLVRNLGRMAFDYTQSNKRTPEKPPARPMAFDCYIWGDVVPHAADTPLIQHMGKAANFQRGQNKLGAQVPPGAIVCDYPPGSRWDPVVNPRAVLVHGCKDGSLIALLRAEMGIAPGSGRPSAPATIVIPAAPVRREVKNLQWADQQKPDAPKPAPPARTATPALNPPQAPRVSTSFVNNEAIATLGDARKLIKHWETCDNKTYGLMQRNGRYRVSCQCGCYSPYLPEGPDWETIWAESAGLPVPTVNPAHAVATHEAGPDGFPQPRKATSFDDMVVDAQNTLPREQTNGAAAGDAIPTDQRRSAGLEAQPASKQSTETEQPAENVAAHKTLIDLRGYAVGHIEGVELEGEESPTRLLSTSPGTPYWEAAPYEIRTVRTSRVPGLAAGDRVLYSRCEPLELQPCIKVDKIGRPITPRSNVPKEVPLQDLLRVKDILLRFPEWKGLTPKQRQRKLNAVKLADRRAKAKELGRQIEAKASEKVLTPEARKRKMELLEIGRGKQGAFIKLRREAEKSGVTGTKRYKKDALILAVLEREFENPYEVLEEAK